jgi:hypothetical protein
MAHFAQLDNNNVVLQVLVVNNSDINYLPFPDSEPVGIAYLKATFGNDTAWSQTSYNKNFRYNYAFIGFAFDPTIAPNGAFISPNPGEGWHLDTATYKWINIPPVVNQPPVVL